MSQSIAPFGFIELVVEFTPPREGEFSGDLVIDSNDPGQPSIRVPVLGRASH